MSKHYRSYRRYQSPNYQTKNFEIQDKSRQTLPKIVRYINRLILMTLLVGGGIYFATKNNSNNLESATTPNNATELNNPSDSTKSSLSKDSTEQIDSIAIQKIRQSIALYNPQILDDTSKDQNGEIEQKVLIPQIKATSENKYWINQADTALAHYLNILLERYQPDGAFYLVVDVKSNEIIAWSQRNDDMIQENPSYLSMSPFPAASLIKAITAGAAIEFNRYGIKSQIPLIGNLHKLYKRQLRVPKNYNGTTMSLEDAFAKSANPIFGIIGQNLGGAKLREFGEKMGFNTKWPNNTPERSEFSPPQSGYALAEAASGFTTKNTISPLLAAAIARAIVSGKPLVLPYSNRINKKYAPQISIGHPENKTLNNTTLWGLNKMFIKTVTHGTSRRSMNKTLFKYNHNRLNIGGKTGTLDGYFPKKARYDWFMGYAQSKKDPNTAAVIIVMQYHFNKRTISSSQIAGLITNTWAKINLD